MKYLKDKVAVITGAGSGIGRSLALHLAEEGCQVALLDINKDYLRQVESSIKHQKQDCSAHVVDISSFEAVQQVSQRLLAKYQKVDLLINNAGVSIARRNVEEVSLDYWKWLMDINFWGTLHTIFCFYPSLSQQPEAHIVNVSSIYSLGGILRRGPYCASKSAINGLTESMIQESRGGNVRVSLVLPGGVATKISAHSRGHDNPNIQAALDRLHTQAARTTPDQAAAKIISGIKRNKKRIMVGWDATLLDYLLRLFPQFAGKMVNAAIDRAEKRAMQQAVQPASKKSST